MAVSAGLSPQGGQEDSEQPFKPTNFSQSYTGGGGGSYSNYITGVVSYVVVCVSVGAVVLARVD